MTTKGIKVCYCCYGQNQPSMILSKGGHCYWSHVTALFLGLSIVWWTKACAIAKIFIYREPFLHGKIFSFSPVHFWERAWWSLQGGVRSGVLVGTVVFRHVQSIQNGYTKTGEYKKKEGRHQGSKCFPSLRVEFSDSTADLDVGKQRLFDAMYFSTQGYHIWLHIYLRERILFWMFVYSLPCLGVRESLSVLVKPTSSNSPWTCSPGHGVDSHASAECRRLVHWLGMSRV